MADNNAPLKRSLILRCGATYCDETNRAIAGDWAGEIRVLERCRRESAWRGEDECTHLGNAACRGDAIGVGQAK